MNLEFPIEEVRKRSLFLAMPCYGGNMAATTAHSLMQLSSMFVHYGISLKPYFLMNESLITRARAYCVDEFIRSDCTHMMFIDSDISFNPNDVVAMLALQSDESEYDVICGPYPKKTISWEKVKMGVDKGYADENPNALENLVGDFVLNTVNSGAIKLNEPVEVLESGTGFMMIRRKTFETYDAAYPHLKYLPDHVRTEHFDGSREIMMYFDTVIDPDSKRYLSEDYFFCQNVRKMGGKVWLCPWMRLGHLGSYMFGGSLVDLAQVGATATADISQLKKGKPKN